MPCAHVRQNFTASPPILATLLLVVVCGIKKNCPWPSPANSSCLGIGNPTYYCRRSCWNQCGPSTQKESFSKSSMQPHMQAQARTRRSTTTMLLVLVTVSQGQDCMYFHVGCCLQDQLMNLPPGSQTYKQTHTIKVLACISFPVLSYYY